MVRKPISDDFYQLKHRISQIFFPSALLSSDVLCLFIHYTKSGIIKRKYLIVWNKMNS